MMKTACNTVTPYRPDGSARSAVDDGTSTVSSANQEILVLEEFSADDAPADVAVDNLQQPSRPLTWRRSSVSDGGKAAAFQAFDRERAELRDAKQMWYTVRGFGLLAAGCLLFSAGAVLDFVSPSWPAGADRVTAGALGAVGAAIIMMAGLMLVMFADHDLDEVFSRRRGLGLVLAILGAISGVALLVVLRSPAFVLWVLPMLCACHPRVLSGAPGYPRWTTLVFVGGASIGQLLGLAGFHAQRAVGATSALLVYDPGGGGSSGGSSSSYIADASAVRLGSWALAVYCALSAAAVAALFRRWSGSTSTMHCAWRCFYAAFLLVGLGLMTSAAVPRSPSWFAPVGFACFAPAAAYLLYGDAISSALGRRFYSGRRLDDSVFVAEMGQPTQARVGDRHDWHDVSAGEWHRAEVTAVREAELDVRLEAGRPSGRRSSTCNQITRTVPNRGAGLSPAALLKMAEDSLRGIKGSNITLELLVSSESTSETYALGEECKYGDVDFFLSHSWHDDAKAKHEAIQKVTADFTREHGREPLFWLDKVCIDQSKITEGLRALPIFLASCKRMLVVAGNTYTGRLW
jgi:hypothetical protein